jgi:hypothetical protein
MSAIRREEEESDSNRVDVRERGSECFLTHDERVEEFFSRKCQLASKCWENNLISVAVDFQFNSARRNSLFCLL